MGHEVGGLLVAGGARVLTAALPDDALRVTPAFPSCAPLPGEWPAVAAARPADGRAVSVLDVAVPPPWVDGSKRIMPVRRARGLAAVPLEDGRPAWVRVAVLGPVPRESNRTRSALYVATAGTNGVRPAPGTPVFRVEDGACLGLLVPTSTVTIALSAPLCVVASVTEDDTIRA